MRPRLYPPARSPESAPAAAPETAAWRRRRRRLAVSLLASVVLLASCSTLGYVGQAAWGQTKILLDRRPIARLLASPETPAELRDKLDTVERIREFAFAELGLPDNGSYRAYVELPPEADGSRRTAVVWNVVAAPELSTAPLTWCFPVAGCVAYRGYFSHRRADRFAERLRRKGFDVTVGGAAAYSTLGWFADPLLSTVIDYPDVHLAGLIFHELSHQLVYVQDDTRFNESFATAVEIEGVRRWLAAAGRSEAETAGYVASLERQDEVSELLLATRDRLQEVYEQDAADDWKRQRKREIFAELQTALREVQESWGETATLDERWLEGEVNNADLASVGNYRELVPGFQRLLEEHDGDLGGFYEAVRELAELSPEERENRLRPLRPAAAGEPRIEIRGYLRVPLPGHETLFVPEGRTRIASGFNPWVALGRIFQHAEETNLSLAVRARIREARRKHSIP